MSRRGNSSDRERFGGHAARLIAGLAIAAIILWLILRQVDARQWTASLRAASGGELAHALALVLAAHGLRMAKFRLAAGPGWRWRDATLVYLASKALGDLTPGRVGEFAPLLAGRYRSGRLAAFFLVDRCLETAATIFVGVVGMSALGMDPRGAWTVAAAAAAVFAGGIYLLNRADLWKRAAAMTDPRSLAGRLMRAAESLSSGFAEFRHTWPALSVITLAACGLGVGFYRTVFASVGADAGYPLAAAMIFLAAIGAFLSLAPLGLGMIEAPIWWLGRMHGIPAEQIIAFMVLTRVLHLLPLWTLFLLALLAARKGGESRPGTP